MTIIGLTGPIAGGKSTVAALLAARGARVIDCDDLAHQVTAPGQPALAAIAARFGADLLPGGVLDRRRLGALVFADPAALAALEAIVHPSVTAALEALLAGATEPLVGIEAIKLFEAGYAERCDAVWVVTAPAGVRLARLCARSGLPPAEAERRLAAQGDFAARLAAADAVLVNDGDAAQLAAQVDEQLTRLRGAARGPAGSQ